MADFDPSNLPNFPNISDLDQVTPQGTEVIQISATQRATLNSIAALFKNLALTGLLPDEEDISVVGNAILATDSLLKAFQKIFARIGKASVAIYPYTTPTVRAIVGLSGTIVFGLKVENSTLYFGVKTEFEPTAENTTIAGLYGAITGWNQLGNGDSILDLGDPGELYLNPGRHVSVQAAPAGNGIILSSGIWATDENKILSASILSTVNITKSMFGQGSSSGLNFLFSKDFDDDPGTPYQVVAAQEYIIGGARVIVFNKAGYSGTIV